MNNLPQPDLWTPLSINGSIKSYLTPEWGTVNKGILNDEEFSILLQNASELYPPHDVYLKEAKEVEQITSNLTPLEKMTAEFWAGGPLTVTPPGMWFLFCDLIIRGICVGAVSFKLSNLNNFPFRHSLRMRILFPAIKRKRYFDLTLIDI